jgi:hypothetical protein
MMNIKFLFITFTLLFASFLYTGAAPSVDKAKARIILMKTNRALGVAHMTVKRTKKFSGKLGRAVKHARFARKQYLAGNFDNSIYHSFYARKLAADVMKENNAKTGADYIFSAEENALMTSSPSDEDLIKEVKADNPADLKDEDLMNGNLEVDVL